MDDKVQSIMALDLFPLLCEAWGESDLPCAFIAYTEAEVRKFIVNEWLGDPADPHADAVIAELAERDWREDGDWEAEFEIGGVSFKRVYESGSREAIAAPGVAQGWVMVPKVASTAMLRPFYECPPDELALAYEAMLIVARRAAPSPTAEQPERPPYCGSGHCSCIECPYGSIKGGPAE